MAVREKSVSRVLGSVKSYATDSVALKRATTRLPLPSLFSRRDDFGGRAIQEVTRSVILEPDTRKSPYDANKQKENGKALLGGATL